MSAGTILQDTVLDLADLARVLARQGGAHHAVSNAARSLRPVAGVALPVPPHLDLHHVELVRLTAPKSRGAPTGHNGPDVLVINV